MSEPFRSLQPGPHRIRLRRSATLRGVDPASNRSPAQSAECSAAPARLRRPQRNTPTRAPPDPPIRLTAAPRGATLIRSEDYMHFRARTAILAAACWLGVRSRAWAQTPAALDSLRRNLSAISARIDSLEAGLCPAEAVSAPSKPTGNARADSLAATLDRLSRRWRRSGRPCAPRSPRNNRRTRPRIWPRFEPPPPKRLG